MRPRGLPPNANLEQLKHGAKSFQGAVRAGDAGAWEVVEAFHPDPPGPGAFKDADAQLVVARRFGFASWPKLHDYFETAARYTRSPAEDPVEPESDADRLLRLACLNYGNDSPARRREAAAMLDADPELGRASIHTAAAAGDAEAAAQFLPAAANEPGGPHDWAPLLYLTYSRLERGDPLAVARMLLDASADPNAGYMWEGLTPPFTALTGTFGGGEGDPPPHSDSLTLARLLLEAGADPNDGQTLYNRGFKPGDDWLELLFEFGLGDSAGGPWHRLLGDSYETPAELLAGELLMAAGHGFTDRVELLLAHGVDPEDRGRHGGHPMHQGRTAIQEALVAGFPQTAEVLRRAGATSGDDDLLWLLAYASDGARAAVQRLVARDPGLVKRARETYPAQLARIAGSARVEGARLLIELGFDVNTFGDRGGAALHEAAARGDLELLEVLLAHGADPHLEDRAYKSTPAGWAEEFGKPDAAALLQDR
ncbi:MAG TPA: ankyrin repeat domain-containing protein [Solirubrobacteraceae bacterium]|nr:ankyrin repeat domain-containing protein [Solirubrobacteraceae bacterium]